MKNISQLFAVFAFIVIGSFVGGAAQAQATRTWVSGVGDDANPCSRTAPCKTFAGAISKTAAGGEINCLDPGGFGGVTITKSIAIICDDVVGGVLVSGTNAININDSATAPGTIRVILRGLDVDGVGTGLVGINFVSGASLLVEDTIVYGFNGSNGAGIRFSSSQPAQLQLNGVTVTSNGTTGGGGGIIIQPTGTGTARVTLRNVSVVANFNTGLTIDATGVTSGIPGANVTIDNSQITGNTAGILATGTGAFVTTMLSRSTINSNTGMGVSSTGFSSVVTVGHSMITGNGGGVSGTGGSVVFSYGNNQLDGNPNYSAPNNGSFNAPTQAPR